MRVILVGTRFLPFRHAGDKNFWLEFAEVLQRMDVELEVLSVTAENVLIPSPYPCRYVQPIPMFPLGASVFNRESHALRATNNYASKVLTFGRILAALRQMHRDFEPDAIHFIDNYGPAMLRLRRTFRKTPLTISAPSYYRRHLLYDAMLLQSYRSFDCVIPFGGPCAQRLREIGLDGGQVRQIPWGVDCERLRPPTDSERANARERLGLDKEAFVVLWTGFVQQSRPPDLEYAIAVAELALQRATSRLCFVFCFKPEHYQQGYKAFERPGIHVHGTARAFYDAREAADVLLSPLLAHGAIAGPALTWLECMSMGIPVISTIGSGAEELVTHKETGLLLSSKQDGALMIDLLNHDSQMLGEL